MSLENAPTEQDNFIKVRMLSVMIENVKYDKFSKPNLTLEFADYTSTAIAPSCFRCIIVGIGSGHMTQLQTSCSCLQKETLVAPSKHSDVTVINAKRNVFM